MPTGHYIVEIDPQGPADKAKLKEFDRVVAVNGQSVEQMQHEQVVETIRKGGDKTTLLISDKTVDDLYSKVRVSNTTRYNYTVFLFCFFYAMFYNTHMNIAILYKYIVLHCLSVLGFPLKFIAPRCTALCI